MSEAAKAVRYVNGRAVDWAQLSVRLSGTNLSEDLVDICGVKYEQKIEREYIQAKGMAPRSKSSGSYKCSGGVTLLYGERMRLLVVLKALSPTGIVADLDFDLLGKFRWPGDDTTYAFELRGCSFDSTSLDTSPGNEGIKGDHDLGPMRVYEGMDGQLICLCEPD